MATNFDFDVHINWAIPSGYMGGSAEVKVQAPIALTIKSVSFCNASGSAFTSAASVENAGSNVTSSEATLAANTTELDDSGLSNTTVAAKADITFIAGDKPSFIVIFAYPTYTA